MYIYISYLYIYIYVLLCSSESFGKKKIDRIFTLIMDKSRCEEEKECKEEKKNLNGIYVKKEKCGRGVK